MFFRNSENQDFVNRMSLNRSILLLARNPYRNEMIDQNKVLGIKRRLFETSVNLFVLGHAVRQVK